MKKQILALMLLMAVGTAAQEKKLDLSSENLLGPVKSTHFEFFKAEEKFGDLVKDSKVSSRTNEYNAEGWLMVSKEIWKEYPGKITYQYDKQGRLIEKKDVDEDETTTTKILYNGDGSESEVNVYNKKGSLQTKRKHKYNEQGQLILSSLYISNGSLKEKEEFTYNAKKQLSEKQLFDAKGQLTEVTMYEYDDKGRTSMETRIEKAGEETYVYGKSFHYNIKGQVVRTDRLAYGTQTTTTFEYDAVGNITREYTNEKNENTYEYTYDGKNNWIKKIETSKSEGSIRKTISERTIHYF